MKKAKRIVYKTQLKGIDRLYPIVAVLMGFIAGLGFEAAGYDGFKGLLKESRNPEFLIMGGSITALLLLCIMLIAKVYTVHRITTVHVNFSPEYLAKIRMVFDRTKN
jgi:hypothetical protein